MPNDDKHLATEFCARVTSGDIPGLLALMTDDVRWFIPGDSQVIPSAGEYDKPKLEKMFKRMYARLPNGVAMRILHAIREGDRIAFEAESSGDLSNGRKYRQRYHIALQARDGKIASAREYLDTQHVYDVWFKP